MYTVHTMNTDLIIGLGIGLAVAVIVAILLKKRGKSDEVISKELEQKVSEMFPKVLEGAMKQLITMNDQKLGAEKKEIKTDLDNKREMISRMVDEVSKKMTENQRTAQSILQQLKDHEMITKELRITTDGLRKVLTNNQLRGQFGEQVAEDLLKMSGFVKGLDFEHNKAQSSSTSRPDFAIFLPDRTRINVDVKFPYANLQKVAESEDESTRNQYMKLFEQDVKKKINEVSSRDYINPADKTVDFVILFVPNEMIFSYIYDKMNDIWRDGMKRKVIFAGPFSFTAILRMIRQAHDNFRYQENIHTIVSYIQQFEKQFELYTEEFGKLGSQLETVQKTYQRVDSTRTKQLEKIVDKIRLESGDVSEPSLPLIMDSEK